MATTIKYDAADWQSEAFRREALKEARKEARNARKRVIIKIGNTKMGYRAIATIDGRFYVGKITTMGILFITACSGEAFSDAQAKNMVDNIQDSGSSEVGPKVVLDANLVPRDSSSETSKETEQKDSQVGKVDSGTEVSTDVQPLTCPSDVSHCDGKAWNGKECSGSFLTVCCLDNGLCGCCVG
jgi:carbamoylphosphate synthase small subunit